MRKFIFLYLGPYPQSIGLESPPLTQAMLSEWAHSASNSLVDKGTLFSVEGRTVQDSGKVTEQPPLPLHGYSIIQAEDFNGALEVAITHPILKNSKPGSFEIDIMELIDGERGMSSDVTSSTIPSGTTANPQQLSPEGPQNNPQGPQYYAPVNGQAEAVSGQQNTPAPQQNPPDQISYNYTSPSPAAPPKNAAPAIPENNDGELSIQHEEDGGDDQFGGPQQTGGPGNMITPDDQGPPPQQY